MKSNLLLLVSGFAILFIGTGFAQTRLSIEIDRRAASIENKVINWRRDIHHNPELGNREFRTAKLVAEHMRGLGLEVKTEVAHTGIVALLKGSKPGPVIALRADMDALPITEEVDLPFASKVKITYEGKEVGVSHACGHDAHVAILMGVAEVLTSLKLELNGTIKFIFQPAEEGTPEGEEGGARLMIKEGVLEDPKPEVIFGLHVSVLYEVGKIAFRSGPAMASADILHITVKGKGTHCAFPWEGVDPIVLGSQIVLGLQTIASRQVDVTKEPSIITISSIHGGDRWNVIPDNIEMTGTIRTYDEGMKTDIHERIKNTAELIAKSAGGNAEVRIESPYIVTVNDPKLAEKMAPTLKRTAGAENIMIAPKAVASEDFSFYQEKIPGLYFFIGISPKGADPAKVAFAHSPRFYLEESGLLLGVRALANLAVDYLESR